MELRLPWNTCSECGGKMRFAGAGSQRYEGEIVHVQVSACESCGHTVRSPDLPREPLPTGPDPELGGWSRTASICREVVAVGLTVNVLDGTDAGKRELPEWCCECVGPPVRLARGTRVSEVPGEARRHPGSQYSCPDCGARRPSS